MTQLPRKSQLRLLLQELEDIPHLWQALALFKTLPLPDFERETEFVSLRGDGHYPWIGGDLISSDGVLRGEDDYLAMTNEYLVDTSTSKLARLSRDSFAVGALARFNNNAEWLHPQAQAAAAGWGWCRPTTIPSTTTWPSWSNVSTSPTNPGDNPHPARLRSNRPFGVFHAVKAGSGVGALEAPRGILYHAYETDDEGRIVRSNCVIPTGQNHANIHHDLLALVPQLAAAGLSEAAISKQAQMLVRAYDPCISCSVH
jgi:sulfhydrogenase subunit alpha